jgi:hypothetical protein
MGAWSRIYSWGFEWERGRREQSLHSVRNDGWFNVIAKKPNDTVADLKFGHYTGKRNPRWPPEGVRYKGEEEPKSTG